MSGSGPVLVSIRSDWSSVSDEPIVGKDVLELLSSSMYVNALSIYREYVQNSADAIEEAIGIGLLAAGKGRVDIHVDPLNRTVRIRDNGVGLSKSVFVRTLVALGASRKRGSKARGFRGVGRLAGLGYCQELIFRSCAEGEREVSELVWDCRRLKTSLADIGFNGTAEGLIKNVVKTRTFVATDSPTRFFEVELVNIVRHGDNSLVSANKIRDYLCQVAPVPFEPEFRFGKHIERRLREFGLGTVLIYINGESSPIYRPFKNSFEAKKGLVDGFKHVRFFELKSDDGSVLALIWLLHHGYHGAIDDRILIKGLRLRAGNIQIGEHDVLNHLFNESRFNSWCVGEIHVVDRKILPNGRRDHFEQSVRFNELLNRLAPLAKKVSRLCRRHSLHRNVLRQFQMSCERATEGISTIVQGVLGNTERNILEKDVLKQLKRMRAISNHLSLHSDEKETLNKTLQRLQDRAEKAFGHKHRPRLLGHIKGAERQSVERVLSLIYDCSPNKQAAKLLIDRILARI